MDEHLSFERFFEEEAESLSRALAVIAGSRAEAEDLAQEAFTRLLERWDRVATLDDPRGYLYRTALNLLRSQRRRLRVALRTRLTAPAADDVFGSIEDRELATQALATLTPRQRAALVLTEVLGYSAEEAGAILGIKGSTIGALRYQARSELRATREVSDV
jgi:RNA polymerase sigma-70 factor (ECF subfamily)